MKKTVLSIVSIIAMNQTVIAGGDITPIETVQASSIGHWSGFYLGGQVGYNWGSADILTYEDLGGGVIYQYQTDDFSLLGFSTGAYGGYNWLFDNEYLFGVEGVWEYTTADDTKRINNTIPTWKHTLEQKWDASILLKAGKVIGNYLPYITAGASWAKLHVKTFNDTANMYFDNADTTVNGWSVGTGLEMELNENYHARIQYLYTNYGNENVAISQNLSASITYSADIDYTTQSLSFGISYQF